MTIKCTSAASHRTAVCGFGESEGQTLRGSSPSTWLKTDRYRSMHYLYLGEQVPKTHISTPGLDGQLRSNFNNSFRLGDQADFCLQRSSRDTHIFMGSISHPTSLAWSFTFVLNQFGSPRLVKLCKYIRVPWPKAAHNQMVLIYEEGVLSYSDIKP